ncbi:MAG: flagellar hook-basal body complex protein FliE [Stappiaceae bacterium]
MSTTSMAANAYQTAANIANRIRETQNDASSQQTDIAGTFGALVSQVTEGAAAGPGVSGDALPSAVSAPDLGSAVKDTLSGVVDLGRSAEAKSVDMLNGKANMVDVVTAIAETEVALETMVSVRDRVISAYEEIMRMPM